MLCRVTVTSPVGLVCGLHGSTSSSKAIVQIQNIIQLTSFAFKTVILFVINAQTGFYLCISSSSNLRPLLNAGVEVNV